MSSSVEISIDQEPTVPFLKWAGGKRWLVSNHTGIFPKKFKRYFEPFLGSGAVFFHLQPKNGILADKNQALVETYKAIRDDWYAVHLELKRHQKQHNDDYYYVERDRKRLRPHTRAAQLIYLNRTCWNGLYRVNLRGEFNVPRGSKDAVCLPTDDFEKIAKILKNKKIIASDFEAIIDQAEKKDFLFIDPPYTVKHNMNGFVKYNDSIFSWADQVRLRDSIARAAERGVQFLVTNADHQSIRALYSDIGSTKKLSRHSILAGKSAARALTSEIIIRNY